MNPARLHVVRDVERTLAMVAAVAVAFALLLGAVAPAAHQTQPPTVAAAKCDREEPGLALPVEPAAAGPSCPSDRAGSTSASDSQATGRPSPAPFPQLSAAGDPAHAGE